MEERKQNQRTKWMAEAPEATETRLCPKVSQQSPCETSTPGSDGTGATTAFKHNSDSPCACSPVQPMASEFQYYSGKHHLAQSPRARLVC